MKTEDILEQQKLKRREDEKEKRQIKQMRNAQLRRELSEMTAQCENLEREIDLLREMSRMEIEPIKIKPDSNTKKVRESTALAVISDLHVFERVRASEVNGLNEYNVSIAHQRINNLFYKLLKLVNVDRSTTKVDNLVLGMLGDLMTNQLHMDQVETNEGTPMEELLFLSEEISGGIQYLLDNGNFKKIYIPWVDGNHGRHTPKIQHANRVKHSYEWLLGNLLARQFASDKRVQFDIAEGQLLYTRVYDKLIRWTHGDAIRYNGGVGGITIPARKAIAEWDKGTKADFTIFGHWHTSHLDKVFCSNGCGIGYAPFSVRIKAAYEPPQQTYMLFDPRYGLSAYRPIYL